MILFFFSNRLIVFEDDPLELREIACFAQKTQQKLTPYQKIWNYFVFVDWSSGSETNFDSFVCLPGAVRSFVGWPILILSPSVYHTFYGWTTSHGLQIHQINVCNLTFYQLQLTKNMRFMTILLVNFFISYSLASLMEININCIGLTDRQCLKNHLFRMLIALRMERRSTFRTVVCSAKSAIEGYGYSGDSLILWGNIRIGKQILKTFSSCKSRNGQIEKNCAAIEWQTPRSKEPIRCGVNTVLTFKRFGYENDLAVETSISLWWENYSQNSELNGKIASRLQITRNTLHWPEEDLIYL